MRFEKKELIASSLLLLPYFLFSLLLFDGILYLATGKDIIFFAWPAMALFRGFSLLFRIDDGFAAIGFFTVAYFIYSAALMAMSLFYMLKVKQAGRESIKYLSIILLILLSPAAVVTGYNLMHQARDSIDLNALVRAHDITAGIKGANYDNGTIKVLLKIEGLKPEFAEYGPYADSEWDYTIDALLYDKNTEFSGPLGYVTFYATYDRESGDWNYNSALGQITDEIEHITLIFPYESVAGSDKRLYLNLRIKIGIDKIFEENIDFGFR